MVQHGDIVLVDLSPTKRSEQDKTRLVLVIQNNIGNPYSPTPINAPFTSSYNKPYPTVVTRRDIHQSGSRHVTVHVITDIKI